MNFIQLDQWVMSPCIDDVDGYHDFLSACLVSGAHERPMQCFRIHTLYSDGHGVG